MGFRPTRRRKFHPLNEREESRQKLWFLGFFVVWTLCTGLAAFGIGEGLI